MKKYDIPKAAIEFYGVDHQLNKATEEFGELIQAVNKWRESPENGKFNLIQEIADVEIMIFQLKEIAKIEDSEIEICKQVKVDRLNDRMTEEAGGKKNE